MKAIAAFALKGLLPERGLRLASVPNAIEKRKAVLPAPHTVPALVWDGDVVLGSDDICSFLDTKFPDGPQLYPPACADEVRRIEQQCAALYFLNGWLSLADKESFERYTGERARAFVRQQYGLVGRCLLHMAPGRVDRLITDFSRKEFFAMLRRRGGEYARLADACVTPAAVLAEAKADLSALDALLAASPTVYFCGASSPTAADLTLYGMLERWVGDSLMPGVHGAAQPQILDGLPAVQAAWAAIRDTFQHTCVLTDLRDYGDLSESIGDVTYPPPEAVAGSRT